MPEFPLALSFLLSSPLFPNLDICQPLTCKGGHGSHIAYFSTYVPVYYLVLSNPFMAAYFASLMSTDSIASHPSPFTGVIKPLITCSAKGVLTARGLTGSHIGEMNADNAHTRRDI